MRAHLGCGALYQLDFGRYKTYEQKGWQPQLKYRVSSVRDLHDSVVPFFQRHPLFGRKLAAFETFADLVLLLVERRHRLPEGLEEAKRLAKNLSLHNERGRGDVPGDVPGHGPVAPPGPERATKQAATSAF